MLLIWLCFITEITSMVNIIIPEVYINYFLASTILLISIKYYVYKYLSTYKYFKIITFFSRIYNFFKNIIIREYNMFIRVLKFNLFLIKNNLFFKEGMYVDVIQKLFFDDWCKFFLFHSTHIYNSNYLSIFIIKLISYILNTNIIYSSLTENDVNIASILFNIMVLFLFIFQFYFIIIVITSILC